MKEKTNKKIVKELIQNKFECEKCEGCGLIQSEQGGKTIVCTKCEGSGYDNTFD